MGEQNTSYLLDGDNIVAETLGGGLINRYIYVVDLISRRSGSTLRYYYQNAHGDVVKISVVARAVTSSYDYDAFGNEKNPFSVLQICAIMQSGNLYVYCINSPVRYWDSSGNFINTFLDKLCNSLGSAGILDSALSAFYSIVFVELGKSMTETIVNR